jgi:hypothetical protein
MLKYCCILYLLGGNKMKILVINSGSSSLKYQLIDMKTEKTAASGMCDVSYGK